MASPKNRSGRPTAGKKVRKVATISNRGRLITSVEYLPREESFGILWKDGTSSAMSLSLAKNLLPPILYKTSLNLPEIAINDQLALAWGALDQEPSSETQSDAPEEHVEMIAWLFEDHPKARGGRGMYGKSSKRGDPFRILMHTMASSNDQDENSYKKLSKIIEECRKKPGTFIQLGFGWKGDLAETRSRQLLVQCNPLRFKSEGRSNCVEAAAANCLFEYDQEAASKVIEAASASSLRKISQFNSFLQTNVKTWGLQNPRKTRQELKGRRHWNDKSKMEWLLSQGSGLFLIQPTDKKGSNIHCVGVDCRYKFLYDPAECFAFELDENALAVACNGEVEDLRGIRDIMELIYLETKRSKRVRRSKSSRARKRARKE